MFTRRLQVVSPTKISPAKLEVQEASEGRRHVIEAEEELHVRFRDFDHYVKRPVLDCSLSSTADLQTRIEKLEELICSPPESLRQRLLEAERKLEEVAAKVNSQQGVLGSFKNWMTRLEQLEQQHLSSSQASLESHSKQELRLGQLEQHMGQKVDPVLVMLSHRIQKLEQAEMNRVAEQRDLEQRLSQTLRSDLDDISFRLEQFQQTWRMKFDRLEKLLAGKTEVTQEAQPAEDLPARLDTRSIMVYNAGEKRVNGIYSPVLPWQGRLKDSPPRPGGGPLTPLTWKKQGDDDWIHITYSEGVWWIAEDAGACSKDLYRTPEDVGVFTARVNDLNSAPVDVPWVACPGGTVSGAAPKTKWAVEPFRLSQVP